MKRLLKHFATKSFKAGGEGDSMDELKLRKKKEEFITSINPAGNGIKAFSLYKQIEPWLDAEVKAFYENDQNEAKNTRDFFKEGEAVIEARCRYFGITWFGELDQNAYQKFADSINDAFANHKPVDTLHSLFASISCVPGNLNICC